jgi:hypothetical protein
MSAPQPIFILASPRSFTSVICAMLGRHPQLYGVPELNLFTAETLEQLVRRMKGSRLQQQHGLLRTIAQLYAGEQTLLSIEMARRWVFNRLHKSTGEVYTELCHKVAPLRIIDKSPSYSMKSIYLNRIRETFPDAYYLHLIRHPRSQGNSVMNLSDGILAQICRSIDYSTKPYTLDPQYLWYRMQSKILDFLSTVPSHQQMRLRGEDILNDPQSQFETICQWLNLDWDESSYEAMLRPQDSPYACIGPYGARFGNDPNFLNSPAFRYRPIAPSQLEGALPWRNDNKGFLPPVIKLAQELGYE